MVWPSAFDRLTAYAGWHSPLEPNGMQSVTSTDPVRRHADLTSAGLPPRRLLRAVSVWLFSFVAGCCLLGLTSQSGCSAGGAEPASTVNLDPAKAVVNAFLQAIKRGDEQGALAMLTDVARAKTQELGLSVAPPVKDTATYSIGDCEAVGDADDIVHVATTWTDTDEDGFTSTDNVIWVCRLDPEGWRVVGMAMRIFADLPPLLLNFEDPEDMLAKQQLVADEITRRAKLAAQQPAGGSATARTADGTGGKVVE